MTDPENKEIVCPFLGTADYERLWKEDPEGRVRVGDFYEGLRKLRFTWPLAVLVCLITPLANRWRDVPRNLFTASFNIRALRGGVLDHKTQSGVGTGAQFDEERFTEFHRYSSDGVFMSAPEVGRAVHWFNEREPSVFGSRICAMELSALIGVFGFQDDTDLFHIEIEALRSLYQRRTFPVGWRPSEKTVGLVTRVIRQVFSGLGG